MPDYEVTSPTGKTYRVTAPDGASQEEVLAYAKGEFAKMEEPKPAPMSIAKADEPGLISKYLGNHPGTTPETNNTWGQAIKNVGQGLGKFATSITGGIAGQVAGLGALGAAAVGDAVTGEVGGSGIDPAAVQEKVTNFGTFPTDSPNSLTNKVLGYPGKVIGESGEALAEITHTKDVPILGDIVRAGPLAAASALGVKAMVPASITAETPALVGGKAATQSVKIPVPEKAPLLKVEGATPKERAQNFVDSRTNLDWNSLSAAFRRRLEEVAATGTNLERLDATAIERQGLLASLEKPITNPTRGQVTRDPLQQRTEQLAKSTDAGAELRDLDLEHNRALTENLDLLRGRTGGKAAGDLQTGQSVQGAARSLAQASKSNYDRLYKVARETEPNAQASIAPITELLTENPSIQHLGWVQTWLNKAAKAAGKEGEPVAMTHATLAELDDLRKLSQKHGGGTDAHYAAELRKSIDKAMDDVPAGAAAWKAARDAFKAHRAEFADQAVVAKLTKSLRGTKDRAVALEDTWNNVVKNGSVEDWQALHKTLSKSPAGKQAIADLKAATVDYIKDKATGGAAGLKNQAGDSHATWAGLKRAVDDIGPDKLREIFGEADAKRITTLVDAAQLLKTEAPMGIKGSPTMDKLLTILDRVGSVPGLGKASEFAGGIVKGVKKVGEIGKAGRDIRHAKTTPLDEARK